MKNMFGRFKELVKAYFYKTNYQVLLVDMLIITIFIYNGCVR